MRPPRCVGGHDAKGRVAEKGDHDGDAARARAVAGGRGGRRHVTPRDARCRSSRRLHVQVPGGCGAGGGPPIRRGRAAGQPSGEVRLPRLAGLRQTGDRIRAGPRAVTPPPPLTSGSAAWHAPVSRLSALPGPHTRRPFFFSTRTLTHGGSVRTRSFYVCARACLPRPLKHRAHIPKRTAVPRPALPRRAAASGCHPRTNPPARHGPPVVAWGVAARPSTRARGGSHTVWRPRRYGRPWPSRGCHRGMIHTPALARRRWAAPHAPRSPRSACRGGRSHHAAPRHGGGRPTPRHAVRPQRSAAPVSARSRGGPPPAPPPLCPRWQDGPGTPPQSAFSRRRRLHPARGPRPIVGGPGAAGQVGS